MKKFTKISLLVIAFTAIIFNANAQTDCKKIKFGVKAGLNLANIAQNFKNSEEESDTKNLVGFSFGGIVKYELNEKMEIQSGLMLSRKGCKTDYKDEWESSEDKMKVTWLEIPFNLAYKINNFQIYAGPYMAFGLSGKYESEESEGDNTISYSNDLKFGNSDSDDIKGFDYGLNLGLGYQTGNLLFNAGYSIGLVNLNSDDSNNDYKISNRVINLSVSYFFGK